jgi:hypothetical protein
MITQDMVNIKSNNNRYANKDVCDVPSLSKHSALYQFPTEKYYILFHYRIQNLKPLTYQ